MGTADAPVQEVKEGDGRAVACMQFKGILTILSHFDHPRCKALRAEMANLATRASVGDEALEKALPVRRQELAPEVRDSLRSGLAGFGDSAIKDMLITQMENLLKVKDQLISEQAARISEQAAGLATAGLALKQQLAITTLEQENARKRRKLLLGAVPAEDEDNEEEKQAPEYPAGSTRKGDARWSRLMEEQARVFCERLARALTAHAKRVRKHCLDGEEVVTPEAVEHANKEALAALRDGVAHILRPANPAVLNRFSRVHGMQTHSGVTRIVCARLPRCNLNSTMLPLSHLFLYLVAKNVWGHGEEIETELELETTLGNEVLGSDLHLYTLDEPHGLVPPDTPEYQLRSERLQLALAGHTEAQKFFECRGIPAKYLRKAPE